MTTKQTERLHKQCIKLGVDFDDGFYFRGDDIQIVIRWSKSFDKPSKELVVSRLKELGCFEISKPRKITFNF